MLQAFGESQLPFLFGEEASLSAREALVGEFAWLPTSQSAGLIGFGRSVLVVPSGHPLEGPLGIGILLTRVL
jgi:hypothetical protein